MRHELILVTCCNMMLYICISYEWAKEHIQMSHMNEKFVTRYISECCDSFVCLSLWLIHMYDFVSHSYVWVRDSFICMSPWLLHKRGFIDFSHVWVRDAFVPHANILKPSQSHRKKSLHISSRLMYTCGFVCIRVGSWRIRSTREYMETTSIHWFWKSGWLIHKSVLCTIIALLPVRSQNDVKVPRKLIDVMNISISTENRISKSVYYTGRSHHISVRDLYIRVSSWRIYTTHEYMETKSVAPEEIIRHISSWLVYTREFVTHSHTLG